jgi:hypothetical protein
MSQTPHVPQEDSTVQQFFASLDHREKISNWFLAIYIVAIILLTIIGGVVLLS